MTQRDKIGLGVLIALFLFFFVLLLHTVNRFGPPKPVGESVIIKQRMINIEKSE